MCPLLIKHFQPFLYCLEFFRRVFHCFCVFYSCFLHTLVAKPYRCKASYKATNGFALSAMLAMHASLSIRNSFLIRHCKRIFSFVESF